MIEILMSIKHEWAVRIYRGEKTVEYRKSSPTVETYGQPLKVYLYESGTGNITGEMMVNGVKVYGPYDSYEEKGNGCVDFELLNEYWNQGNGKLHCWRIGKATKYLSPLPLKNFGVSRPPMSWQYLAEKQPSLFSNF